MSALVRRLALIAAWIVLLHAPAFGAPPSCPPTAAMPTPEQMQAGAKAARDHGFLWRLRKDGRESWLYGTVHVARLEWAFPGPTIVTALKASDTVALELDVLDPEIQQRMIQGARASTATALPEPLRQRLQRQAEAECLPPQALAGMTPEMQVATLESLIGRRDGLDPSYGIDIVLDGWARATKKPVVSLETPELQLATLAMPTPAETLEFVDSSLSEIETGQAAPSLKQIAQVWADGDLDRLSHYESWCDCVKTPADRVAMKRLLDDRNPGLADSIAALHARGQRVFAAVGSLHMIGPLGLPNLLAQRGFEVRPVPFPRR
ncbi:MAG TPA: TraB/GumN family protein [Burkholderiaceae bacterium]|jgi:hypothetical protein